MFSPNLFYLGFNDDGASYVSHAFTLGLDADLDYTNEPVDQFSKNKLMPRHPIGSGILAAPFVAIFGLIDRVISHPIILDHNNYLGSWSLFGFVFSVNLLFLIGIYLYLKSFQLLGILNKNYWLIIIIIFSSTVPHYIFRSYYFSHGFEFFAISLLLWSIAILYKNKLNNNKIIYYILFVFSLSLNIFIRYSNINLLLLAPIVFCIMDYFIKNDHKKYSTIKNLFPITIIALLPNSIFFRLKYGSFMPLPSKIYNNDYGLESSSIIDSIGTIFNRLPYVLNITLGSEMGLLYTNPVIPIGFISLIILIIINTKNKGGLHKTIILVSLIIVFYGFGFSTHLWWQGMASSYGYRYLLQLLPISIIGVLIAKKYLINNKIMYLIYYNRLIITFCTISIFSLVFFSSTEKLQLSEGINTFGVEKTYSGNGYMLDLPLEVLKPYTWVRLIGKSTFGYFLAPILINCNLFNIDSLIINSKAYNDHKRDDILKLINRPKEMNLNNISQLLILLFLWFVAGSLFKKYEKIIIYDRIDN